MPTFDVFVSYSKFSIYRADGEHASEEDNWPGLLAELTKAKVEEALGQSIESFYVYSERPLGEDWTNMLKNVSRAKILLPILSETYFSSITCFQEWLAFASNSDDFGKVSNVVTKRDLDIFPVFRFEEVGEDDGNLLGKMLTTALKELKAAYEERGEEFSETHNKHVSDWVTRLLRNENALKMSDDAFANTRNGFRGPRVRRRILKLSEVIARALSTEELPAHLITELQRMADVSVLALGLDKYKEGGWGFSLGPHFERDREGEFLIRGRHEVNLFVLRALKQVLPRTEFISEVRQTLLKPLKDNGTKFTKSPVRDRKEHAVALSSLLNARREFNQELAARVDNLSEELSHNPITERWVLNRGNADNLSDAVIFFDLSARAREYVKEFPDFMEGRIDPQIVEQSHQMAQRSLQLWADASRIFQNIDTEILNNLVREPGVPFIGAKVGKELGVANKIISELLSFRLVCSLKESAREFVAKSNDIHLVSHLTTRFNKAFARLKQIDCPAAELSYFLKVFPVYLLSVKDLIFHAPEMNSDLVTHVKALEKMWFDLVEDRGGLQLASFMNAVSWAASIIYIERLQLDNAQEKLQEEYREIWSSVDKIRTNRVDALTASIEGDASSDAQSNFKNFVSQGIKLAGGTDRLAWLNTEKIDPLFRGLYAFGGSSENKSKASPTRLNSAIGLLLVDAKDNAVVSATAGFSAIYIEPIIDSLGLGIKSRERLVYELGTTDAELISGLSNSVVQDCWALDDENAKAELVDFVRRTSKVSELVATQRVKISSDPGKSYKDLLRLKTINKAQSRFVLRTCSRVTTDDLVGIEDLEVDERSGELILWTFSDVTNWAKNGLFGSLQDGPSAENLDDV